MHRTQAHSERLAGTLASLFSSPDISWFKGRQPISAWNRTMVSTDGRVLLIEQAQLSDAGSYRCVASNVVGSTELQYSLRVNGELLRTKGICPQSCCSSICPISHPPILPFFHPPPILHPFIHPSCLPSIIHSPINHPCIHASFHLSFLPSTYHLSIHPFNYPFFHLNMETPNCPSTDSTNHSILCPSNPPTHLTIQLSIPQPFFCSNINSSICPSSIQPLLLGIDTTQRYCSFGSRPPQ